MSKLTLKDLKLSDTINSETNTFIRPPAPSEAYELESMCLLDDWLHWASLNNLVSQARYISLSSYLDTIPSVGEYVRILSNHLSVDYHEYLIYLKLYS